VASLSKDIDLQIADFRILKKLGEGAAGVVYHARQISFDRDAAVKVLFKHVAATPKLVERFYREARLAGRLDHPNIVQGYCVGEDRGLHYFAMEYVDGQSLQQWLEQLGRLRVGDAVHILLAIARGLAYAHEQDLVHRDVKPANVLIGRQGEVKVVDLGMAKIREDDLAALTRTGRGLGTPCFMPMEQFVNAKDADVRCDIYALGCTLHALLTGRPPFMSPSFMELIQAKEVGKFPPARTVNPEVPESLDLVIGRMTAKRPEDRYQTCAEVIKTLEGLGLASAQVRLERLAQEARPQAPAAQSGKATASGTSANTTASVPQVSPKQASAPSTPEVRAAAAAPAIARVNTEAGDAWQVKYTPQGASQAVRWQLTTTQLLEWIAGGDFTSNATARQGARGEDRPLAAYPELRKAVLDRVTPKATKPEPARLAARPSPTETRQPKRSSDTAIPRAAVRPRPPEQTQRPERAAEAAPSAKPTWPRTVGILAAGVGAGLVAFFALRALIQLLFGPFE
jgi:serine/threonine-protein kinase